MNEMNRVTSVWPEEQEYVRAIVTALYLLVVGLLSVLLSHRWGTWSHLRRMSFVHLLVVLLLAASLLFVFISAIIILGVGSSYSYAACSGGIWLCVLLYAGTKAILYILLLEKLAIVHSHTSGGRTSRFKSWWYRGGLLLFTGWIAVAIAMIIGRIAKIREDGACLIGLTRWSTIPMLVVDACTNVYLTVGFVWPVWRSAFPAARRLARISCIAAVASLVTSFANIFILTLQHGHQLSWVCLGSCGLDVAFNSVMCYLVTRPSVTRDEAATVNSSAGREATQLSKPRVSRSTSYFPGSHTVAFGRNNSGTGSIGVHIVEEVEIKEEIDDEPALPPSRRLSMAARRGPLVPAANTMPALLAVSFESHADSADDLDVRADEKV